MIVEQEYHKVIFLICRMITVVVVVMDENLGSLLEGNCHETDLMPTWWMLLALLAPGEGGRSLDSLCPRKAYTRIFSSSSSSFILIFPVYFSLSHHLAPRHFL